MEAGSEWRGYRVTCPNIDKHTPTICVESHNKVVTDDSQLPPHCDDCHCMMSMVGDRVREMAANITETARHMAPRRYYDEGRGCFIEVHEDATDIIDRQLRSLICDERREGMELAAKLCARIRCRNWDAEECASQIRELAKKDVNNG